MKTAKVLAAVAAVCQIGCATKVEKPPEAPQVEAPKAVVMRLVQDTGGVFVFCASGCSEASAKTIYLALDASSTVARERVLARLRTRMVQQQQDGSVKDGKDPKDSTSVVVVDKAAPGDAKGDAWTIYAIEGDASNEKTVGELKRIVEATPRARYYLLAPEEKATSMGAVKETLGKLGVAKREIGTFVLQSTVRTDAVIPTLKNGGESKTAGKSEARQHLLVIRPVEPKP